MQSYQLRNVTIGIDASDPIRLITTISVGSDQYDPQADGPLGLWFDSKGVVDSVTSTEYDSAGRVTRTIDQYGLQSINRYGRIKGDGGSFESEKRE